ncbi:MAG: polymerase III subunit beta protein [Candidatus Levybacteria bacterium GW2011_GWA2_36_13]|nr:MAG: polymerase III subunit beta protein [Candidatus Levybacteria bacterium GW2011_GWA2_36_13]
MKATVLSDSLKQRLPTVFHAISGRSQLPVLLNFLIEAKSGFLTISATDLEIGIVTKIGAKIEKEGKITVPAKTFFDLISNISEEKLTLEARETTLELKGEHLKATFPTMPAGEFPEIVSDKGKKLASLNKNALFESIAKVSFAASVDSGRPALSGVLLKKEAGGITLVATDGYRLSLKKKITLTNESLSENLLVPSRILKELLFLRESGEDFDLYVSEKANQIILETKSTILTARLIEAEYPDYQKIIPEDYETKAIFNKEEAQNAVKACSVFAREAANIIKVSLKKGKIVFSSSASSVGENEIEIESKVEGEENEIAFNSRYLLDFLNAVTEEIIELQMTGPLNPGVFKTEKDKDYLHIIMPIRVQN